MKKSRRNPNKDHRSKEDRLLDETIRRRGLNSPKRFGHVKGLRKKKHQ